MKIFAGGGRGEGRGGYSRLPRTGEGWGAKNISEHRIGVPAYKTIPFKGMDVTRAAAAGFGTTA